MVEEESRTWGPYRIRVPEQGIDVRLETQDHAIQWIDTQIDFWKRVQGVLPEAVVLQNANAYEARDFITRITRNFEKARRQVSEGEPPEAINTFIAAARRLEFILAGGLIADDMQRPMKAKHADRVFGYVFAFCLPYVPQNIVSGTGVWGDIFAAFASAHPAKRMLADLMEFQTARQDIQEQERRYIEISGNIEDLQKLVRSNLDGWAGEMAAMKRTYQADIKLREPAKYWGARRTVNYAVAFLTFALFVLILAGAGYTAYWHADDLLNFIQAHRSATNDDVQLSWLTGFAFVAVPVAGVAWILRHVSRLFIQSLNSANDAGFRKSLAITYLALVEQVPNMEEEDRALVLNALFRPAPTEPKDEGPPAGLLELFRK